MTASRTTNRPETGSVAAMRNLGPKSVQWLGEIGIHDAEELRAAGAVETYVRLRFVLGRKISLNMLYALEAAIRDIDWRHLSAEDKAALIARLPDR